MTQLRIVLVEPKTGENVGFVARLCDNFQVEQIVLVHPSSNWEAGAKITACMSLERLASIQVLPCLEEALEGADLILGFTAREGKERLTRNVRGLASVIRKSKAKTTALLFGSEDNGLPASATNLCNLLFRIELRGMSSLNLSHAVAIALHEADSGRIQVGLEEFEARTRKGRSRMTFEDKNFLVGRAFQVLTSTPFQFDEPHLEGTLHRLLHQGALQTRDGRTLHKILTFVEWLREKGEDSPHWPREEDCG
jgi:TrmH family RNA methyltransferase